MSSDAPTFDYLANTMVEMSLKLKTAYSAMNYAIYPCSGVNRLKSRDDLMNAVALKRNIPIKGLESAAEVDTFRSQVTNEMLLKIIMNIFSKDVEQAFSGVVQALNTGDYDAFQEAMKKASPNAKDRAFFEGLMVVGRNKLWAPRLMEYLDEGDAFVLVGASHVAGPQGLVSMLQAQGYKFESTCLPARKIMQ